jgi:hypothetical protein
MRRLATFYGAHPLHLLALLGCFALAGYAALHTSVNPSWPRMLAWFLAAVIGHDLILFPLYALADRSLALSVLRPHRTGSPLVPAVNHIRVPALGAGLLFLLFFPGILKRGASTYLAATGQTQQPYLQRWLLLTAALFGLSALAYAIRLRLAGIPRRTAAKATAATIGPLAEPGERILATAYRSDGTAAAVATTHALYHPATEGWQRIHWEDLATVHWRHDEGDLVVTGLPGSGIPRTTLPLADPARLPAVAESLITATIITTRRVHLDTTHRAVITARKSPWSDRLVWTVHLDHGLDTPEIQTRVDAAITAIRTDLGLPLTTSTSQWAWR